MEIKFFCCVFFSEALIIPLRGILACVWSSSHSSSQSPVFYCCFSCRSVTQWGSTSLSWPSLSKGGQHPIAEPHKEHQTLVFGQFIACCWAAGGGRRTQAQGEHSKPTQSEPRHSTHNLRLLSDNTSNPCTAVWSMSNSFLCKVFHLFWEKKHKYFTQSVDFHLQPIQDFKESVFDGVFAGEWLAHFPHREINLCPISKLSKRVAGTCNVSEPKMHECGSRVSFLTQCRIIVSDMMLPCEMFKFRLC